MENAAKEIEIVNEKGDVMEVVEDTSHPENAPEIPNVESINKKDEERLMGLAKACDIKVSIKKLNENLQKAVNAAIFFRDKAKEERKRKFINLIPYSPSVIQASWHDRLATDIKLGRTILVRGASGNGKSFGAMHILKSLGYNVYALDCTDSTTPENLVGGLEPVPDGKGAMSMEFRNGAVCKAFSDPKGALLLEEYDALDPRIAMCLQTALLRNHATRKRWVSCPDHSKGGIESKGDCPIVVTMNTWGHGADRDYVGRNTIDAANLDRFDSLIDTTYENEQSILFAHGHDNKTCGVLENFAKIVRDKIKQRGMRIVFSTRRLLAIAESATILGCSLKEAVERDFLFRLPPSDRDALISDLNEALGKM